MKDHINQARWLAILVVTAIALYLCWLMLRPFIEVLSWAAVLVTVFYPVHKRLAARIRRPGLSALASSLLVLIVFVVPFIFLIVTLANELTGAARNLPAHAAALLEAQAPFTRRVSGWLHERLLVDGARSQAFIAEQLNNAGAALLGQSIGLIGDIIGGIFKAFFVIFTMYYLFRDGDKFVRALPEVLPFEKTQSQALISRVNEVVGAGVYGVVSIALIQGLLSGLAFWVLGVPSPVLWAVVTAFICMVPIAGSFFVWLPASIFLMVAGQWSKGIGLIIWGALVVSTIDNFLRPRLIKNQTKLHELFIFFSVLGGIRVFGLLGIVLGPVIFAVTLALLETFRHNREITDQMPSAHSPLRPEAARHRTAA
jgi:predicted PurR-regulated permease PerM